MEAKYERKKIGFRWAEAKLDSKWEQEDCFFERKGPVARFTLNRPEKRNAYTRDMWQGMHRACEEIKDDLSCRVLVITGAGDKAFCAGPSIIPKPGESYEPPDNEYLRRQQRRIANARHDPIIEMEIPVVCRLNGLAVGAGMDWVLACDLIVAAEHAYMGQWYGKRGLITDMGGAWYLPRLCGLNRAKELIFTAKTLTAQEAKEMGIVNRVVPPEKLDEAVDELCNEIIQCAPLAVRMDKDLINKAWNMTHREFFDGYMVLPLLLQQHLHDGPEGFRAFREGREPEWEGR